MSDYSSTAPSLRGPRSPLFGTATYSSLTTSQGPLSPSRRSSTLSYSDSRISSNDSEDASTDRRMRRINLSPVPSSRESDGYSYSEEDSIDEQDEVEAALTQVEEEIEDTLQAWTRDPITIDRDRRILSTITEHTENNNSRPTSGVVGGPRPLSQLSNHSRTAQSNIVVTPTGHMRSTTDPTIRPNTPGRGVSHIIAQFEAKKAAGDGVSPFAQGHSRTASAPVGPRSPSPYTLPTSSQTLPTLSTLTRDPSYTTSGFGSTSGHGYSSRPSSPTKSRGGSAVSGPRPPPSVDSRVTPALHSRTQSEFSESTGAHSRTGSFTNTFTGLSGTGSVTESLADTPSAYSLRRPQTSPRSPITQVTNIVAAWKGKTPVLSKVGRTSLTSSPALSDGGRRRRSITPRTVSAKARRVSDVSSDAGVLQTPISTGSEQVNATAVLPPPFDASEFGITGEPLNIGLLWYLNVHAPLPYRWQRCQAVLYPHMLLLTWIAPGGGRGIVTLDLLNCTEVRTALSPTHREARDDVGAIAAKQQSMHASRGAPGVQPGEDGLAETLSPFHLMYGDGIERLGTESPRERLAWVNAIWEVLERPLTIPDRSSTTSPVGSVRTIGSYTSGSSSQSSSVGSASTNYISPLHSGDILDAVSLSGTSSLSRKPSVASSQTRALDDNALSNQTYLPHADPRVIPPSRMSSLRRTSSLTDLDAEFDSALRRARNARPGLGFGLSLAAGVPMGEALPVTISSGARLGSPVSLTPPPRDRSRTRVSETASSVSEDPFFSASSTQTRTPTSSFYSTSSFTQGLTTTGIATDETIVLIGSSTASQAGSRAIASPTSYRDTASPSLLTASQNVTMTASTTVSPTRNGLTRSREVRRRAATITRTPTTSYLSGTEESSDKENAASYSGTRFSTDEYPSEFSTLDTLTRTEVDSYYSSEDWTRSGTPTPSTVSSSRPTSHFNTSESDVPPPSSSRTSEYYSAKSPTISLSSIPTIPSESDFETAEICSAPSDYVTVDVCRTGSVTDFETAEICSTVPASDFVTCEVCASDVSTEYGTARCHCATKAEEVSLETIELTEEREDDAASVKTPSVVPTIPSPSYASSELGEEVRPEDIPLPPTNYSPSLASTESLSYLELPPVPPKSPPTPTQSLTSSPSLPLPSPLSEPLEPPRQHTLSTISSPTESSITPTTSSEPSLTVPSTLEQPSASSPTIPESIWAPETDRSYESSVLRASPSTRSIAVPEGQDFSFETSIFRPTSVVTSGEVSLVTPVSQLSLTPSVTAPTTRSSTLTVPSTPTLPPSVPSPTPVSSERSPTPTSKTPSEVSTPTTPSLSSSIFAPSPLNLPSSPAPSTATSLLSTRPPSPERSPPPMIIPMPPSPSPSTPSASIVVSVSTPQGSTPSIHSALETELRTTVEEPGQIWTNDMNRLLERLDTMDHARGAENAEMHDDVRQIRDLLAGLKDDLARREEVPPQSDRSVGGESPLERPLQAPPSAPVTPPSQQIHDVPSTPTPKPRAQPIIELSPPRVRSASPDTLSDTISFLSSHHSDEFSLMESETYPIRQTSPSWSSEESESTVSSPTSSISLRPRSEFSIARESTPSLVSDEIATPPPPSPTPSSSSSITARPVPPINLGDLRDILDNVLGGVSDLRENQDATNRAINDLRQRPEGHLPEVADRLARLEALLGNVLNRLPAPDATRTAPQPQPPQERDDGSESLYTTSDSSTIFRTVRDFLDRSRREPRTIQVPTPVRAGPSFDEQLAELIATTHPVEGLGVQQPPPLVPLIYRPGPRLGRPRSASPTFESDLPPRPGTFPQTERVIFERRPAAPLRPILRPSAPAAPEGVPSAELDVPYTPATASQALQDTGPGRRPESGPDIDFEQQVRDRRRRRLGQDGIYYPGQSGRAPSAPPSLGQGVEPPPGQSWYHGRPPPAPTGQTPGASAIPPPGMFANIPVGRDAAQAVIQLPGVEDIIALLRENRMAQVATIEQQREIMRYMRGLNEWLERDVHDRQEEIRAVTSRVDQLRDLLMQGLPRPGEAPMTSVGQDGPPVPPPPIIFPPGTTQAAPPSAPPFGPGMPEPRIPVIPEHPGSQLPPGFIPGSNVVPPFYERLTPSPSFTPVIPDRPQDHRPHVPVIPNMPYSDTGPYVATPFRHQRPMEEDYEDAVVPPRPSPPRRESYSPTRTSQSSDLYTDGQEPLPRPPPGMQMPMSMQEPSIVQLPPSRPTPPSVTGSSDTEQHVDVRIHPPSPPVAHIPAPGETQTHPMEGTAPHYIVAPQGTQQFGESGMQQPAIVIQPPTGGMQGFSQVPTSMSEEPPRVIRTGEPHTQPPVTFIVGSRHSDERSPSRMEYDASRPSRSRRSRSRSRTPSSSRHERFEIAPSPQPAIVIQPPYAAGQMPMPGPGAPPSGPIFMQPGTHTGAESPPIIVHTRTHRTSRSPSYREYSESPSGRRRRRRTDSEAGRPYSGDYSPSSRRRRRPTESEADRPRSRSPETHRRYRSHSRSPTRYHHVESEGPRHDPTSVVRTHTRERSRSDPRSRSRSPSRQVPVVIQPSGHIQQPILVPQSDRRRSRSRSPHTAPPFVAHARSSDRPGQPIIIRTERPGSVEGDRGHRHSRSPYSRRRSRSPGGTRFFSRSRRSRSRSPTRTHRVSRSPTRHSYSPARTHSVSRSPTRHSRSRTTRRSRSPVHRVSRSPTRHSRSRITRRSRSPAHRVSRSPTRHDYPRSVIGRRRSSRSPTQRAHSGHMSPTSRDYSSSPTRRRRVARSSSQHDESRSPTRRGSPSRRPAMVEDDRGHPSSRRSPIRRTHTERSRSPVTHRVARSRTPPLQLGSTGRSPRVIRTQGTYRSRSPTLVGTQVEPIRLQVGSSTRSPGYEDPTRRIHRSPTDYSEHEEPHGRRLARRPGSRSPSPRRRESEILPVRPPSRIRTHPARGGPPTVITLPGDRTHTPPSSPSPRIIQVPSSPRPRRGRDRIPSDVTHRPYSRSVERTPAAGPIRDSSPHSQVSELEHAFSVDEPIAPSRRVPSSRRRVSPTADLRDQLRPARPDVPVIPYIPSVSRVEEPQVSVPASHGVPSERLTSQSASPVPVPAPIPSEQDPRTVPTTHIRTGHSPSSHVPAAVLPPSPPHAPVMIVPSHTYSGPHDLDYADAERERAERFEQAQMQIGQHLQAAEEAEEQRERDFRENEEARQRIFEENEARRQQELQHHQDEYLRQIDDRVEDRLAGLPTVTPLPVPPPHEGPAPYAPSGMSLPSRRSSISASIAPSRLEADQGLPVMPPPSSPEAHIEDMGDVHSIAQSLHHSVLDAASRHSQDMLETLRLEREEMHRQLDEERLERERRQAELAAVRDQRESDLMERIRHLEDRLAATESAHEQTKADLEQERQVRITEETERREAERDEDRQRAEDAALQLSELTNVATATRDELARKREVSDERWATKEVWKEQKDRDVSDMKDMLSNMQRMFEDCERRREEERAAEAGKPSIESVLQELKNENATLRQLFAELAEGLRADSQRHLEEILGAVRSTAQEQVPFNISGYLDEFSKTLAKEVRQLLTEVNELVENKTRLQFEIATLMEFKAKYEPGGFFWKQGSQMPVPMPAEAPPPEAPPAPPTEPVQAPPAWRTMRPRRGRRPREQAAAPAPAAPMAPPPPPMAPQHMAPQSMMQMDPARSWVAWQPSHTYIPSPSSELVEPQPAPPPVDTRPAGLFGPRTPRESMYE